jgi:hypothetical protein
MRQLSNFAHSSPSSPIDEQQKQPFNPFTFEKRTASHRSNSGGDKESGGGGLSKHVRSPSVQLKSKRLYASSPPISPESSEKNLPIILNGDDKNNDSSFRSGIDKVDVVTAPSIAPSTNSSGSKKSARGKQDKGNPVVIKLDSQASGCDQGPQGDLDSRSLGPSFNSLNNSFNKTNASIGNDKMALELKNNASDTNISVVQQQQQQEQQSKGQLLQVPSLASSSKNSSSSIASATTSQSIAVPLITSAPDLALMVEPTPPSNDIAPATDNRHLEQQDLECEEDELEPFMKSVKKEKNDYFF